MEDKIHDFMFDIVLMLVFTIRVNFLKQFPKPKVQHFGKVRRIRKCGSILKISLEIEYIHTYTNVKISKIQVYLSDWQKINGIDLTQTVIPRRNNGLECISDKWILKGKP